ncbi:MAG: RES family NAD+ phosphorylase [Cyanosarcina radialis HA8281-LM2]|nr:RES family NAD+ phosphorylase [Cyanosarcina radialis HA8281-LM2]
MMNPTNDLPGLHPPPPLDLFNRKLPIITVAAGTIFYRVHQTIHNPIYFGNSGRSRFDIPEGIIYLGIDEYVAFRETIGRFSQYRLINSDVLERRRMTEIVSDRDLSLVDLTGNKLTLLDADGRLFTGSYEIAQEWAKKFQEHPEQPDGIYYRSRHDPSRFCLALYKLRVSSILRAIDTLDFLSKKYEKRLAAILDEYQYGLI